MRVITLLFLFTALSLSVGASAAQADPLVQNGDFSVSDGGLGALDWSGGLLNSGTGGNDGQPNVLVLNSTFGLSTSQTGSTVNGQLYALEDYYNNSTYLDTPTVLWDGTALTPAFTFTSTTNGDYVGQIFFVTGTGSDTVGFSTAPGTEVDNSDVSLTAVPELNLCNGLLPLGLCLIAGLLLADRRRQADTNAA